MKFIYTDVCTILNRKQCPLGFFVYLSTTLTTFVVYLSIILITHTLYLDI